MLVCPACQREYDPGLQFCAHDARELVPATDPAARATAPGMTCPNCRRSFDAMKRFCPFDGDELVPLTLALGSPSGPSALSATASMAGVASVVSGPDIATGASVASVSMMMMGKICPHCSRRYDSDATFCGRDGSSLVSVN
jgi:predicted amidophosphoribosyltransferase